jgi:hypothetical protein
LTIPRRLAFRCLADVLGGQARRLRSQTPGRTAGRRDPYAAEHTAAKMPGRLDKALSLASQANRISGWIGDKAAYQGDDLDPIVFAGLVCLAYGDMRYRESVCQEAGVAPAGHGADTVADLLATICGLED